MELLLTLSFSLAVLACAWLLSRRQNRPVRWSLQLGLGLLLLGMMLPAAAVQGLQQWLGPLLGSVAARPSSGLASVLAHITLFALAGALLGRLRGGVGWLVVAGFLAGLSVMTEVMQHFSAGRHPSLADVGYNLFGIGLGLGVLLLLGRSARGRSVPA